MKKYIILIFSIICCLSLVACGTSKKEDIDFNFEKEHNFSVNKSEINLEVNDSFELIAKYGEEKVTFSIEDSSVATVSESGVVTALKEGCTYVNIVSAGEKRYCKVNVVTYNYTVKIDGKEKINATVGTVLHFLAKTYLNEEEYDGKISWTVTGGNIVADGNTVIFTSNEKGVFTLTAKTDKGASSSCVITVGDSLSDFSD